MEKYSLIWWLLGGGVVIFAIEAIRNNQSSTMTSSGTISNQPVQAAGSESAIDDTLSSLAPKYGQNDVDYAGKLLQAIYDATNPKTGQPLTVLQQQLMLSQALQETGLFTAKPNLHLVGDFNNYAGVKVGHANAQYKAPGTSFAKYPDIPSFVSDWLRILNFDFGAGAPLNATNANDFVARLNVNGYFDQKTDLKPYQKNVPFYFDLLSGYITG